MAGFSRTLDFIETVSEKSGRWASLLVILIMLITTSEVVSRYVFNHPTIYCWPLNRMLFGVFILFAGVYAMKNNMHIRIEIFYEHFPLPLKFIARLIALASFLLFMGILVWQTAWMGWNSLTTGELFVGAFRIPLYPFKVLIPLVCFLFLLEGLVVFLRGRD